ncbi:MAG: DNA-binding protein WhiA [Christensenellaceae bacterium]
MNFSLKVKEELLGKGFSKKECELSCLSGFLRTSASIITKQSQIGFVAVSDKKTVEYFKQIIFNNYGLNALVKAEKDNKNRAKLELVTQNSFKILQDLKIISLDGQTVTVEWKIGDELISTEDEKVAYMVGAFLGSGSVTLPKINQTSTTGYHFEVVFSRYVTAVDFCEMLAYFGIFAKLIERKETFVVYLKNAQNINDVITRLGAIKCSLDMTELIIEKDIKNQTNRKVNCEMFNMSKQVNALIKDKEAIEIIEQTIGIDSLPTNLKQVAIARLNNESATLSELSETLKITKSCLNHRLRKLNKIAESLVKF